MAATLRTNNLWLEVIDFEQNIPVSFNSLYQWDLLMCKYWDPPNVFTTFDPVWKLRNATIPLSTIVRRTSFRLSWFSVCFGLSIPNTHKNRKASPCTIMIWCGHNVESEKMRTQAIGDNTKEVRDRFWWRGVPTLMEHIFRGHGKVSGELLLQYQSGCHVGATWQYRNVSKLWEMKNSDNNTIQCSFLIFWNSYKLLYGIYLVFPLGLGVLFLVGLGMPQIGVLSCWTSGLKKAAHGSETRWRLASRLDEPFLPWASVIQNGALLEPLENPEQSWNTSLFKFVAFACFVFFYKVLVPRGNSKATPGSILPKAEPDKNTPLNSLFREYHVTSFERKFCAFAVASDNCVLAKTMMVVAFI